MARTVAALRLVVILAGIVTAALVRPVLQEELGAGFYPATPTWPTEYSTQIQVSDFYGPTVAAAYYSVSLNAQRYDVFGPNGTVVRRVYNYTSQRQYILDESSGTCYWLPLYDSVVPSIPIGLGLANYTDVNVTVNGQLCYQWTIPIFYQSSYVSYVTLYTSIANGLPVRFSGGAVASYDFVNLTVPADGASAAWFDAVIPNLASCAGPSSGPFFTSIPYSNVSIVASAQPQLDQLVSPQSVGNLGGDGGQSTVLPPRAGSNESAGQRVYIVSDDSMIGFELHGQRVGFFGPISNMVEIVTGGTPELNYTDRNREFYANSVPRSDGSPLPFFSPPTANVGSGNRAWTNGATVDPTSDTFYMISEANGNNNTQYWLLTVKNSSLTVFAWQPTWSLTPFSQGSVTMAAAGTILIEPDGFAYILGHTKGFLFQRNFAWARVPFTDLQAGDFSRVQYWSAWLGWMESFDEILLTTIFQSDAGCSTVGYHPGLQIYYALTVNADGFVGVAVATNITGPYLAQPKAFPLPPALTDGFLPYCPAAQNQWLDEASKADSILLTYVENGAQQSLRVQSSPNGYIERFVKLTLAGDFKQQQ
jgi:hypothetical protein